MLFWGSMKTSKFLFSLAALACVSNLYAQGPRPEDLGATPADLGSPGIVWYPVLEDGLKEAARSNRPILFMAVASQCSGISGVF